MWKCIHKNFLRKFNNDLVFTIFFVFLYSTTNSNIEFPFYQNLLRKI